MKAMEIVRWECPQCGRQHLSKFGRHDTGGQLCPCMPDPIRYARADWTENASCKQCGHAYPHLRTGCTFPPVAWDGYAPCGCPAFVRQEEAMDQPDRGPVQGAEFNPQMEARIILDKVTTDSQATARNGREIQVDKFLEEVELLISQKIRYWERVRLLEDEMRRAAVELAERADLGADVPHGVIVGP